jgi:hypothetical protein
MAHRFPRVLEPNERERLLSDAREQNYLTRLPDYPQSAASLLSELLGEGWDLPGFEGVAAEDKAVALLHAELRALPLDGKIRSVHEKLQPRTTQRRRGPPQSHEQR